MRCLPRFLDSRMSWGRAPAVCRLQFRSRPNLLRSQTFLPRGIFRSMEWADEGIVLGVRRHGESSAIVELLTRGHGRHLGLVRGGSGKRMRPMLQRTLDDFDDVCEAAIHLVKFELAMLTEVDFELNLENCAATGETAELI